TVIQSGGGSGAFSLSVRCRKWLQRRHGGSRSIYCRLSYCLQYGHFQDWSMYGVCRLSTLEEDISCTVRTTRQHTKGRNRCKWEKERMLNDVRSRTAATGRQPLYS